MAEGRTRRRRRGRRRVGPVAVLATCAVGLLSLLALSRLLEARRQLTFVRGSLQTARAAVVSRDDEGAALALDNAAAHAAAARRAGRALPLGLVRPIPLLGSPARGTTAATGAATEAIAAGRLVAQAARSFPTRLQGGVDGSDLSPFAAAAVRSQAALAQAEEHVAAAARHLRGPKGAALPVISTPAKDLDREMARTRRQLDRARRGMALFADLAAPTADSRLLVLGQDSLELRPTGGYIGSYGILHFAHGTVKLEGYQDSQLLPPPDPPMAPPEDLAPALPAYWSITNANWWPDFPTSARTAAELYRRQGGGAVDGVVALTEYTTARLIDVVGPLQLPSYGKPVTGEGFDRRAVYELEQKRPLDTPRKKFLTELADSLFERLSHLPEGKVSALTEALDRSVGSGDVQLWFADEARQGQLAGSVAAGSLPRPAGDFVMLVDANLTASKANLGVVKDVTYRVRRRRDGWLEARLDAVVRNDEGPDESLNPYYNGYLRVYVPAGARLARPAPGQDDAGLAPDGPYRVLTQMLDVQPKASQHVRFDYLLPPSVAPGGSYRLTWVRQAGTPRDSLSAVVAGRAAAVGAADRSLQVDRSLRGNAVAEWFRRRWIVRKLGL